MSEESLAILDEIFKGDAIGDGPARADGNLQLPTIAENLKLARGRRRKKKSSTDTTNMENKSTAKTGVRRDGKFAFIKTMIAESTHTFDQIVAATQAKFPDWSLALVKCGVYSSRTQMRKAALPGDWIAAAAATESQVADTVAIVPPEALPAE